MNKYKTTYFNFSHNIKHKGSKDREKDKQYYHIGIIMQSFSFEQKRMIRKKTDRLSWHDRFFSFTLFY